MDSLSIIAYKQPISRYEIEAIRGVDSSGVLKTLLGKKLIKIKGENNGPGGPIISTLILFLEYFGINRLSDLPKLKEITELMDSGPNLGEQILRIVKNESVETDSKDEQSPEIVAG